MIKVSNSYIFRILNDVLENKAPIGLVRDGTKCSDNKMCLHSKCVPVASIVKEACPMGENGKLCSGNGVSLVCNTPNLWVLC